MPLLLSLPTIDDSSPEQGQRIVCTASATGTANPVTFQYQWGYYTDNSSGGGGGSPPGTRVALFNRTLPSAADPYKADILAAMDELETYIRPNAAITTDISGAANGCATCSSFAISNNDSFLAAASMSSYWSSQSVGFINSSGFALTAGPGLQSLSASQRKTVWMHELLHSLGVVWANQLTPGSQLRQDIEACLGPMEQSGQYFWGSIYDGVINDYKRITGFTGATKVPVSTDPGHWGEVLMDNQYPGYLNALMSPGRTGRLDSRVLSSQTLKFLESWGYEIIKDAVADPDVNSSPTIPVTRSAEKWRCGVDLQFWPRINLADFTVIAGATSAGYTLTAQDVGRKIACRITAVDTITNETVTRHSEWTSAVTEATPDPGGGSGGGGGGSSARYPNLIPTSRSYDSGDFANTKYRANSGAEYRILYGSKRTGMKLQLAYENITDVQAEQFLDHYHAMKGTFQQFELTDGLEGTKAGWAGNGDALGAVMWGSQWRYAGPPQLTSVYPGVSTVTVNLIGATIN